MADNIISRLTDSIQRAFDNPAKPEQPIIEDSWIDAWTALSNLQQAAEEIPLAESAPAWVAAVLSWKLRFVDLAVTLASYRGFTQDLATKHAVEDLIVRLLMERSPGVAKALSLLGLTTAITDINIVGYVRYDLDWEILAEYLADLDKKSQDAWNEDPIATPSAYGALLLMAPEVVPMLGDGDLKIAPVPFPPVVGDPADPWVQFRGQSSEWVNFTLIQTPTANPPAADDPIGEDRHLFELISDANPERTFTFALRSKQYPDPAGGNGDNVTDFEAWLYFEPGRQEFRIPAKGRRYLRVSPATLFGFGYDGGAHTWNGFIDPNGPFLPPRPEDPAVVEFVNDDIEDQPDLLIGARHDSHLVVKDLGAWLKVYRGQPGVEIGAKVHDLSVVIMPSLFGSFGKYVRDGIRFELNLDLSFVPGVGLALNHNAGLETLFVLNLSKWGMTLHSVRLTFESKAIQVTNPDGSSSPRLRWRGLVSIHFSIEVGFFLMVVDGTGVWYGLWDGADPEVWGIEPFTGVGFRMEDRHVQAGGYLYQKPARPPVKEEYGGSFYLKIRDFEVLAFGIYKQMEDGTTSFLILLGTRFQPGITLPFGLQLQGIGGLIATNRRADTDRLWQRLTIGTIGTILTVDDPIKNAPIILGDLDYLFPVTNGVHLFGPTFRFLWLKQVQFDVAILAEIATSNQAYGGTGLVKLVIIGTAKLERKAGNRKLVDMTLNLVGLLDLSRNLLAIDAVLHKSRVMDAFKVTGTAAVRMSMGGRPYMMVTIGGFHPKFNPEPAVFPKLDRLALIYDGEVKKDLTLRAEAYLAVTSNSIQAGFKAEAKITSGKFSAEGMLSIDALIQFFPFYFDVAIAVKVSVRYRGRTLAGVSLEGGISGPGPLTIYGKFTIEILFLDFSWSGSFRLGSAATQALAVINRLLDALIPELSAPANLEADGSDDRLVVINTAGVENGVPVLPPMGGLVWSQRRAPLNCLLERFEGTPLASAQAVRIVVPNATTTSVSEWFSPGSFTNLNDSEALNQPAFERLESGVKIGMGAAKSQIVGKNVGVHIFYLPDPQPVDAALAGSIPDLLVEAVDGRQAPSNDFARRPSTIGVREPGWTLRSLSGAAIQQGLSQTDAHGRARRARAVALPDRDLVTLNL